MRATRRIASMLLFAGLGLSLSGCFQSAGNPVEPTIALTTATPPVSAPLPTLPPVQPIAPTQPTIVPPKTTVPATIAPNIQPTNPHPVLAPTFTPFITLIGDQGFQTPIPTVANIQPTAPLFPPSQTPVAAPDSQPTSEVPANPTAPGAIPTLGNDALATPTALPTDPPCDYTVQRNDTFYAIARKLNLKPEELIAANPRANPNAIQIGDVLRVPNCKPPTPTAAPTNAAPLNPTPTAPDPASPTLPPGAQSIYTIVSGDTLGRIAVKYGVTVQDIVKANNFANESVILNIGQKIIIPAKQN